MKPEADVTILLSDVYVIIAVFSTVSQGCAIARKTFSHYFKLLAGSKLDGHKIRSSK
jgi:hypothetical protein